MGAVEFMDQAATDMNAQITKVKAGSADTLFLTTSVEQITLVLKQAQEQRLTRKIITTGGSSSPSQLIKQAGAAAEGTLHILFFLPWFPEAMPDGKLAKAFVDEWAKRGHPFEGLTEGLPRPRRRDHRGGRPQDRGQARSQGGARRAVDGERDGRERADQVREGRARPARRAGRASRASSSSRSRTARSRSRPSPPRSRRGAGGAVPAGPALPAPAERAAAGQHLQSARDRADAGLRAR